MNPEYGASRRPVDAWSKLPLLGRLADALQPPLLRFFGSEDPRTRAVSDALHGTPIGHALHPMITDIPIGAWTVTAVCDSLELLGTVRYRDAADAALAVGIFGAVGAAITGLADWSDTKDEPQRVGMLHAIINSAALTSYLVSFAARKARARKLGIAAGCAGYALMGAAAYLGGELSLGMQLGAKHTAVPIEPPDTFRPAIDTSALTPDGMHAAAIDGIPVLVASVAGKPVAVTGVCTHRGAPLAQGTREGDCVRCPWHGSLFALDGGGVARGPATFPLASFETRTNGNAVEVKAKV